MSESENVSIDYQAIMNQLVDKAIGEFLTSFCTDEKSKRIMSGTFAVHRKHGIDAMTTFKIMMDLAEVYKNEEDHANG